MKNKERRSDFCEQPERTHSVCVKHQHLQDIRMMRADTIVLGLCGVLMREQKTDAEIM